ncbi:MAG: hypothetical protein AAF542_12915 [Pseudomonadota bacterium]
MSASKIGGHTLCVLALILSFSIKAKTNTESSSVSASLTEEADTTPSLRQLLSNDRVRINSWVQPSSKTVVGQQLELNIEVATSSWFSGGTRIGRFELDDAIVLRRNKFAVNSSRREEGQSWSVQLWTITIYPQRSGSFTIPVIDVHVSVANPENPSAAINGLLQTEQLQFGVTLPEVIYEKSISHWIASSEFTISDEFDKPLSADRTFEAINVGDAIRRTITLRAENVAAMMLPAIDARSTQGLAAYSRPARLEDRINRGTYFAIRREVISYVAENEGVYTLPEIILHWWNTQTSNLEQIVLPSHQLHVGTAASDSTVFQANYFARTSAYWLTLALVLAAFAYLLRKSVWVQRWLYVLKRLVYRESQQQKCRLIRTYPSTDPAIHVFKTLQWLETYGPGARQTVRAQLKDHPNPDLLRLFDRMMQHAFGDNASPLSHQEYSFFIDEIDRSLYRVDVGIDNDEPRLNPRLT